MDQAAARDRLEEYQRKRADLEQEIADIERDMPDAQRDGVADLKRFELQNALEKLARLDQDHANGE